MANKFGIKLHYSSLGHPQSHALAERTNLTLERIILKYTDQFPKTWDQVLNYFLLALRGSQMNQRNLAQMRSFLDVHYEAYWQLHVIARRTTIQLKASSKYPQLNT